ncbi:MarR family winged helix-turn-helix transcriptional regulator [Actinomadura sp. WMMB 499]|uniref:MarR family winged helix-turn-helix transcriptional regulator n=1 Tax=Actinomadura sp. WMMB 499 TaxID=1219491 RepID=UPI001247CB76|nr:MarR family transcriptional regulator [Actinomadura sp. WMMB 499]QFG23605.1 MarR family transcriptional regulator [Actinomadura sp. WMMB 499]
MADRESGSGAGPAEVPPEPRAGADGAAGGEPDRTDEIVRQWRAMRPDLDPSPIALLGRLHRAYLRYNALASRLFERNGLNAAAFDVLITLRRSGPPYRRSARELAEASLLSSAGVTLRMDRLEKAGLIVRERDEHDRRVVYSRLTDQGFELIDRLLAEHLDNERAMIAGLADEQVAQLTGLLRALERSLEAAEDAAERGDGGSGGDR